MPSIAVRNDVICDARRAASAAVEPRELPRLRYGGFCDSNPGTRQRLADADDWSQGQRRCFSASAMSAESGSPRARETR